MVFPASHGVTRAPQYSGTASKKIVVFHLRDSHPLWLSVPGAFCYTNDFVTSRDKSLKQPHNPICIATDGLGSSLFARRY